MNAQGEYDDASIFPLDFLPQVLSGNMNFVVRKARKSHPHLMYSRWIILPVIHDGQATVIAVVNPIGLLVPEFAKTRGISFILSLHPGSKESAPNMSSVSRRIRLFLNKLASEDTSIASDVKFDYKNLGYHKPEGEVFIMHHITNIIAFIYFTSFSCSARAAFQSRQRYHCSKANTFDDSHWQHEVHESRCT